MRRPAIVLGIAVLAGVAIYFAWPRPKVPAGDPGATSATSPGSPTPAKTGDITTTVVASATPSPADSSGARFFEFGDGAGALGQGATKEGHPIAPSSFLVDDGGLVVLDQEKSRIVLADGTSIRLPGKRADDIARGADGSLAVLDRLDAKDVAILDRDGHVRGRLPLAGTGIDDPKDVTRLVVSGNDVFVERNGGGPLLRVGGTDGRPGDRTEIQGIPTRDGKFLVSAGITVADEGRAWLTLADRQAVHRWTRELRFPAELSAVAFLDSDANGSIWVVLLGGSSAADYVNWALCVDQATGATRKSITLTVENPPWESFRDYAVQPDGSLVAATRTERGVTFATYPCR